MKCWRAADRPSRSTWSITALIPALCLAVSSGCASNRAIPFRPHAMGDILTMARRDLPPIGAIRCKGGHLNAKLTDQSGTHRYNLDMTLLFQEPRDLYISGRVLGAPQLYIGSNSQRYWVELLARSRRLCWGVWQNQHPTSDSQLTIGPERLVEVLGSVKLRDLSGRYIGPILQRRPPYHVMLYSAVDELGNLYIAKEIFLTVHDRLTVSRITYYDRDGNIELEMTLDDHRLTGLRDGQQVYIARKIKLAWPTHSSYLKLDLGRVALLDEAPSDAFEFPDMDDFDEVEQIDAADVD